MDNPQDTTLADILEAVGAPFSVNGASFRIRPPTTEEYDDAMAIERMVRKRWQNDPALAQLREEPCSPEERAGYEALIRAADVEFHAAEDGSAAKDALLERIAMLQRMLEGRTMADEVAGERATLARDRYLVQRLLSDEKGAPLLDPRAPDFAQQWERLPMAVKNAARPAIWAVLAQVRNAPFSLAVLRGQRPA